MPNVGHARWLVTYTAPYDDHQFRHNRVANTIDDESFVRGRWKDQHNPDWRLLRVQKLPLDVDEAKPIVDEADRQNREAGGDEHRIPRDNEDLLTQKQVDKIRADRAAGVQEADALPPVPGTTFGGGNRGR